MTRLEDLVGRQALTKSELVEARRMVTGALGTALREIARAHGTAQINVKDAASALTSLSHELGDLRGVPGWLAKLTGANAVRIDQAVAEYLKGLAQGTVTFGS
jgi:hypothetical protein